MRNLLKVVNRDMKYADILIPYYLGLHVKFTGAF